MYAPRWNNTEQGSEEWLKARLGCLTASRMGDAMSFLKGGRESEARRKLKIELLAERFTEMANDCFVNAAMRWGIEMEQEAKDRYEEITGTIIKPCGFALHGEIDCFGASPDGLLGSEGLIEIKCPTSTTHLQWLIDGVVPEQHKPQMMAQIIVTGRKWCDFMSYDPRFPGGKDYFIRRFEPIENELKEVENQALIFLNELDGLAEQLNLQEAA